MSTATLSYSGSIATPSLRPRLAAAQTAASARVCSPASSTRWSRADAQAMRELAMHAICCREQRGKDRLGLHERRPAGALGNLEHSWC